MKYHKKFIMNKMIENLKKNYIKYKHTLFVKSVSIAYDYFKYYVISDKLFVKLTFLISHEYAIDLRNPKSLNEKIQWLKLYDRTELHTQCADKFKVRDYVQNKIGKEYLIPLIFFTKNAKDISPANISNFPCIIKTNHNSSGGQIINDLENQDWEAHQKWLLKNLNENYYFKSREWQYKNIERGIVVEKLLKCKNGNIPFDYKVHCFNGKPKLIQVDLHRNTDNYSRNWYTIDWEIAPFEWSSVKNGESKGSKNEYVSPPKNLKKMLKLSSKLSSDFIYSRIDWYNVDGYLYFGEITFHHDSGLIPIKPVEWDFKLGNELLLPLEKNK